MPESTSLVAPIADSGLNIDDITCPITQAVFIEPVKTNCNHLVEKLALAYLLREDKKCPICRTIVTSATLDEELVQKIQNNFIKIHGVVNEENKRAFDEQKDSMDNDPLYHRVRGLSVIPKIRISRRPADMTWREALRATLNNDSREPAAEEYPAPRAEEPYTQVMNAIENDNLDVAELIADGMDYRKDECYKSITAARLRKINSDVSNIEIHLCNAINVTNKINRSNLKNDLFSQIVFKCVINKKFSKAFQTVKKIDSFVLRFLNRILICAGAVVHGFAFVLRVFLLPFRVLLERLRY